MPQPTNKQTQFWEELKRRKVFRVIAMYAATAFILLELVDIVVPSLGLPALPPDSRFGGSKGSLGDALTYR